MVVNGGDTLLAGPRIEVRGRLHHPTEKYSVRESSYVSLFRSKSRRGFQKNFR